MKKSQLIKDLRLVILGLLISVAVFSINAGFAGEKFSDGKPFGDWLWFLPPIIIAGITTRYLSNCINSILIQLEKNQ